MFSDTKKKIKTERAVRELKHSKLMVTYMHKFNLQSDYTKLETLKLVVFKVELMLYHFFSHFQHFLKCFANSLWLDKKVVICCKIS